MAYAGYKRHDHAILPFGFGLSDQLLGAFWAGTPVRRRPIEQARGQLADRCMMRVTQKHVSVPMWTDQNASG